MPAKRPFQPSALLNIFASQVGSHVGGALLGLVFWMLAARTLTPEQVGLGAALVAAMSLLSMLGLFGVGTLLIERFKFVAVVDRWPLFTTGMTTATAGGVLVATIWCAIYEFVPLDGVLGDLSAHTLLLLVGATGVATTCAVFDQAAIGMGATGSQLRRNILASCMRIAFLAAAIMVDFESGEIILVSWIVGLAGSLLASRIRGQVLPRSGVAVTQRWRLVREYWTTAVGHHGLTLALASGSVMIPVVVASLMSAEQTAFFSQARLLADSALAIPYLLTISLFATVQDPDGFRLNARRTIVLGMVLALCFVVGAALLGRFVLLLFGEQYARESQPLLLLLLLGGPALVIKDHVAVLWRVQGKRIWGAVAMACWTAVELAATVVGGLLGSPTSVCISWLVASAVCSLIALPLLISGIRGATPATPSEGSAADTDQALCEFWNSYVESGRRRIRYVLREPQRFLHLLAEIRKLAVVRVERPSDRAGGRAVRQVIDLRGPYGVPARWWGSAALAVPANASDYLEGPQAQTLRRKIRAAERHGISSRLVQPDERMSLLTRASGVEQVHRDEQYRVATPQNDDLLEHDLWMVTEDPPGNPLLLAVIPVDGAFATLRYFRTLGAGESYSLSRYLATNAVVAELSKQGVRWLLDTAPSGAQTNGVRHFQRMVGFGYVRIVQVKCRGPLMTARPELCPADHASVTPDDVRRHVQAAP